jgi:hypothetical protein
VWPWASRMRKQLVFGAATALPAKRVAATAIEMAAFMADFLRLTDAGLDTG